MMENTTNMEIPDACTTTTTTTTTDSCFDFLSLPTELKRRTAYFLTTRDVIHLGQTCHLVQHALVLRKLQPSRWLTVPTTTTTAAATTTTRAAIDTTDSDTLWRVVPRIPVWNRRVHSVRLTVQYQIPLRVGAAGARGPPLDSFCFYVTAHAAATTATVPLRYYREDNNNNNNPLAVGGRTMAFLRGFHRTTGTTNTWNIQWTPLEGEIYYIWYTPDQVRILSMELQTRILDDFDSVVSRQYTKLARLGVLCHHNPDAANTASNTTSTALTAAAAAEHYHHNNTNTNSNTSNHHQPQPAPTLFFYPQLLLHVAQSLRTTAMAGYALVQFWQQQAGLSLEPRDLAALEEILQADLEERQWRLLEQQQQEQIVAQAVGAMDRDQEAAMH